MSPLESLPSELVLHILSFLEADDIAILQRVSRTLCRCARDNTLWRVRCFESPGGFDTVNHHQLPLQESALRTRDLVCGHSQAQEYIRLLDNWDPFFEGENPNWYEEYIHRNAPIQINWFQQTYHANPRPKYMLDARGVGLYHPISQPSDTYAVTPMADGSVYLWDARGRNGHRLGSVTAKSSVGSLFYKGKGMGRKGELPDNGVVEGVAVDSFNDRAFFAVGSSLLQVDLQTLQTIGAQKFEWVISALSPSHPGVPLTVGTNYGLHLYDYRTQSNVPSDPNEKLDTFAARIFDDSPLPPYAPLPQPSPLGVLHLEEPGQPHSISSDIYVTGRFSNILLFDRRRFDRMVGSIYSGASLCSLASLPFATSTLDQDLRLHGKMTSEQAKQSKRANGHRTLIAGGEYNTKGSLEMYDLQPPGHRDLQKGVFKNRQTAASSKILSVVTHGSRIAFSDSSGYIKWVERDGRTTVRKWKIGHSFTGTEDSLFATMPGSDDVARKLLVTSRPGADATEVNNSDIVFWTGERLGLVKFSSKERTLPFEDESDEISEAERALEEEERRYAQQMGQALRFHANEVRFMYDLGLQ